MATAEYRGQPSPSSGIVTMDTAADGGLLRTPIGNRVQNESKVTVDSGTRVHTKKVQGGTKKQKYMHLINSTVSFVNAIKALSSDHKDAIKSMGFGGLLRMPGTCLIRQMIDKIANRYQISNQCFFICGQDGPIYLEDVRDIMGLQIEGIDVFKHVNQEEVKDEDKKVDIELMKRYEDADHLLTISKLKQMMMKSGTPDDDFKRLFVLFTIGVILAPTVKPYIKASYLPVVRKISDIPKFNWGQFTLTHLLTSCNNYIVKKRANIQGNLTLLQFWYWERVIAYTKYGINYETIQPPLMARWTEDNAGLRWHAFDQAGLDGGTVQQQILQLPQSIVDPSTPTSAQGQPSMATSSQVRLSMPNLHKFGYANMASVALSNVGFDILEFNKKYQLQESPQILVKKSAPGGPLHFSHALARINAEAHTKTKVKMEKNTQQQNSPSTQHQGDASTHITSRKPIVDNDYKVSPIDTEARCFIVMSYDHAKVVQIGDHAKVVQIGDHVLTTKQLRPNFTDGFIVDEVINAYVDFSNVETEEASFITTFQAWKLPTNNLGDQRLIFKKLIADKCVQRHLVFVPMHINKNHWALLVLNFIKKEVQLLNFLASTRGENQEKALEEEYYANNPDEQRQHEQAENSSDVQIIETKTPNPEDSTKEGKGTKGTGSEKGT
ncbi:unnamed protein product [Miscanthus lutarioriparius]|uniref:Aminotransferase-like plant mobile domain-containing protein n=1 Tax=Miscanthus lutarioriparius TaxID=422564 RepID=A0A811Q9T8_9POAL|nr:unnamed protein product [Miscanthus lutarioriparius]